MLEKIDISIDDWILSLPSGTEVSVYPILGIESDMIIDSSPLSKDLFFFNAHYRDEEIDYILQEEGTKGSNSESIYTYYPVSWKEENKFFTLESRERPRFFYHLIRKAVFYSWSPQIRHLIPKLIEMNVPVYLKYLNPDDETLLEEINSIIQKTLDKHFAFKDTRAIPPAEVLAPILMADVEKILMRSGIGELIEKTIKLRLTHPISREDMYLTVVKDTVKFEVEK